jgi:hypothetical protein
MRALSSNLPFFKEEKSIDKLNHLLAISSSLMPHQVAAATGCPLEEALSLLFVVRNVSI